MPLPDGYELLTTPPDATTYRMLRTRAGLSARSSAQAAGAVAGSWSFRAVRAEDGVIVSMGRVVGDGGWYFLIADMATLPGHQRRGLGGAVLDALLADIRDRAPAGAYVTLTADPPGRALYESRGFRDVAPGRTGMSLLL